MIQLECSNCKTILTIDDAFAGGVCRCQKCGTIQTVPKPGDVATADANSQKALFKRKARIESALSAYNDELDRVADEVESGGNLTPSAISNIPANRRSSPTDSVNGTKVSSTASSIPSQRNNKSAVGKTQEKPPAATTGKPHFVPKPSISAATAPESGRAMSKRTAFIASGLGLAVLVLVVAGLMLPGKSSKPKEQPASQPEPTPATANIVQIPATAKSDNNVLVIIQETPNPSSPNILSLPLDTSAVVYIVDRSGCTPTVFQRMVDACLKSAQSLSASSKFQIAVWNNNKKLSYPETILSPADAAGIAAARNALIDTFASPSDIAPIITNAKNAGATDVVLISAVDLDETNFQTITSTVKTLGLKLHGIAVGSELTTERLHTLSSESAGGFKKIDLDLLN